MNRQDLVKGNAYFIVLDDGHVYQGEYRGWHKETCCYWFKPLPFAFAVEGPQWVFERRVRAVIDLGTPRLGSEFERAIESLILE